MDKKLIWLFFPIIFLLISNKSFAGKPVEIIADGEYVMGAGETMEVAEEKAKKSAMQKAAEQAGAFVKSYTKVKNLALESDVIEVIANHSMKVDILEKKKTVLGDVDAIRFYVKIRATLTEEEIEANLKKVREDQRIVDAYNRLKADYEKQDKEISKLKRQLELATAGDKEKIAKLISEEEKKYKANLWVERAQSLITHWMVDLVDLNVILNSYKRAIELNPDHALAYAGIASLMLQKVQKVSMKKYISESETFSENELKTIIKDLESALINLDKAISIDENYADAYALRAEVREQIKWAKWKMQSITGEDFDEKQYNEQIIEDINRAIALNASNKADLYEKRASLMSSISIMCEGSSSDIENYLNKALMDINQAIALCKDDWKLSFYYRTKASIYLSASSCYSLKDDDKKQEEMQRLHDEWWQKAEEVEKALSQRIQQEEKEDTLLKKLQATEFGKLLELLDSWQERVTGTKNFNPKSDEGKLKIAEIKKRISSGKASAEDYLFMAMFMSDDPVETRKNNFAKGIELFEKRAPQNREALLLVDFYHSQARFLSDNQLYDESLSGLGKAKAIVDKHLTKQKLSKELIDLWKEFQKTEEEEEKINTLSKLNKDEAEAFFWILSSRHIISLRAEIYEKLGLYSKALGEYRYLCEQLQDEKACKDVERLK
jgi:tetratricopeptide (TPR) repeat protein